YYVNAVASVLPRRAADDGSLGDRLVEGHAGGGERRKRVSGAGVPVGKADRPDQRGAASQLANGCECRVEVAAELAQKRRVPGAALAPPRLQGVIAPVEARAADPEQDDLGVPQGLPGSRVRPDLSQQHVAGLAADGQVGDVHRRASRLVHECGVTPDPALPGWVTLAGRIRVAQGDDADRLCRSRRSRDRRTLTVRLAEFAATHQRTEQTHDSQREAVYGSHGYPLVRASGWAGWLGRCRGRGKPRSDLNAALFAGIAVTFRSAPGPRPS